ncbi:tRNA pseudouridine(55) synthase TruB [Desulforudis sp. 1088]|uniref:tRNA pseudouridine(55) synthase TruB n=2 Tax=Candidatus Desulforudis TaxID=471826 RepID=UPI003CE57C6A
MDGILNILKPPGMTSHDVVSFVRRQSGLKKVGHSGTLDPGACGVLVICLGRATRSIRFLSANDKTYRAEVTFGLTTDTQDAFGKITSRDDASSLSAEEILAALKSLEGRQMQVPPMISAVKQGGRKLYEIAREGLEVEREPRAIEVYAIKPVHLAGLGTSHPRALFDVHCSKGTYVRTLCHEAGRRLGKGACLSFLLRTSVGSFDLQSSLTLGEVRFSAAAGRLKQRLIAVDEALAFLPGVVVRPSARAAVLSGRRLFAAGVTSMPEKLQGFVRLVDDRGLLAVAECCETEPVSFRPVWVWARQDDGEAP